MSVHFLEHVQSFLLISWRLGGECEGDAALLTRMSHYVVLEPDINVLPLYELAINKIAST